MESTLVSSDSSHSIITDVTVIFGPCNNASSVRASEAWRWNYVPKDLHLNSCKETAWLYFSQAKEEELTIGDQVVLEIRASEPKDSSIDTSWESRPAGLWLLKGGYKEGTDDSFVTGVDVLFGEDAVEPRPGWALVRSSLRLHADPSVPAAQVTVRHGKAKPKPGKTPPLIARTDAKFKMVQISDTHMVTGPGMCKDAIDAHGNHLPESVADPLTMEFIGEILDIEQPDLVILNGDQLHHDIADSQSALFKVASPMIHRQIPYAFVFGNHDSEGTHALSRAAQMSLYQNLPYSICFPGPEDVEGVGNYFIEILSPSNQRPFSTLFFLDSHGQIESQVKNPDYDWIKRSQINWFTNTSQTLRKRREGRDTNRTSGAPHLSLAFMHIPLPELADDSRLQVGGQRREPTEGPSFNSHFYDVLQQEKIAAVGFGHDHVNDFCALDTSQKDFEQTYKGPWLCYGGGSGFGGYCSYGKERYHRRARVWELDSMNRGIRTWKRLEYAQERTDELTLVKDGLVVRPQEVTALEMEL
ncbi:unnamed protein product [Clonostachys rosea]|uniref:Calcineurin-like phosphoesterase domain-containing protein n=1 Tax=Bionectria ochroleuca TaxID=29856 RepID=A0ABY6U4R1_BIOOC|nr:unnamed protein product [Clonostachys rosea]